MKPLPHVRANISDDGLILLDTESGRIYSANATAARIWRGLECGQPLEEIVATIAADTGTDVAVVERDAAGFVDMLKAQSLVGEA